jgi:hypothetical protein
MKKLFCSIVVLIGLVLPVAAQTTTGLRNLGFVVVSPNGPLDGGDFGPATPGTTTAGFQEAFVYAKNNIREVYIVGGGVSYGGNTVTYQLSTTLHIPWGQDWHSDGGDYVMEFTQTSGDCLVIDSQMNCQFKFGVVIAPNLTSGSVVKIAPTSVGPDNFIVCVSSIIRINAIYAGGVGTGTGLDIDSSTGGVVSSNIYVGEINGCDIGARFRSGSNDSVNILHIDNCNTLLQVDGGGPNHFTANLDSGGVTTVIGANLVGGGQSRFDLSFQNPFGAGKALVFGSGATDNLVYVQGLDPAGVANSASAPTNRIISAKPVGFSVPTPAIPASNTYLTNTTSYSVAITILTPGVVTAWTIRDANNSSTNASVTGSFFAGQMIFLQPGESIRFTYSSAPTWKWRELR